MTSRCLTSDIWETTYWYADWLSRQSNCPWELNVEIIVIGNWNSWYEGNSVIIWCSISLIDRSNTHLCKQSVCAHFYVVQRTISYQKSLGVYWSHYYYSWCFLTRWISYSSDTNVKNRSCGYILSCCKINLRTVEIYQRELSPSIIYKWRASCNVNLSRKSNLKSSSFWN